MAGRGDQPGRDLDDWFAEPVVAPPRPRRGTELVDDAAPTVEDAQSPADDWLAGVVRPARRRRSPQQLSGRNRVALAAGALVLLLLVGLAAGGVFSSSRPKPPAAISTAGHSTTAPETTSTTSHVLSLPTVTLKPGDTGAQVRGLQRALATLGYSPGAVDGNYGPATERAVVQFQQHASLTPDGVLGPKTLNALLRAAGP